MLPHILIGFSILVLVTWLHERSKSTRRKEYIDECFDDMYDWIRKAEHAMDFIDIDYELKGIWKVAFQSHPRYDNLTEQLYDYMRERKIQVANKKLAVDTTGELKVI